MTIVLTRLVLQGLLGAADTLWFHAYKLRLYLKPFAITELALHALRDFTYAVLFASLAWWSWHGLLALCLGAFLVTEIVITLVDFIVEDKSRKVPAGERTMHAIMGMVYGAFIGYLFPELVLWFDRPTGLSGHDYGWVSWTLSVMAMGVLLSGIRDMAASRVLRRSNI